MVTVLLPQKYFCTIKKLMKYAFTVTCMILLTSLTLLRVVLFWVSVSEHVSLQMVYMLNAFASCVKLNG